MKHPAGKSLVLYCMPLMERGVGSAWGLPVIAAGKERFSALSLSEKLEPPGIPAAGADPFGAERLRELEALGIGPLGRYIGGEPIKPVRLGPEDFFGRKKTERLEPGRNRGGQTAAELFCTALEFDDVDCAARWIADGPVAELFRHHLEFLRTWGFSGGVTIEKAALAPLTAEYINYLQKETARQKPAAKIIVLVSRHFFEGPLAAELPAAKALGDPAAGEIPVNYSFGGGPVLGPDHTGPGIVLYEDLPSMLRVQKARCDILIPVTAAGDNGAHNIFFGEIAARLVLEISAGKPAKQSGKTPAAQKVPPVNSFLFRNLTAVKHGGNSAAGNPAALPFPAGRKTELAMDWRAHGAWRPDGQKAAGCFFAVNAKFSGLRAVDFKEEQALFYREGSGLRGQNREPPPIQYGAGFSGLNETQLEFFFRWRSECRRGFVPMPDHHLSGPAEYIETYIRLYANELALCMGREGPLRHFHSLLCLFHACGENFPDTAALLCRWLLDFAVIYDITAEALPLLLDELWNNGWFGKAADNVDDETATLLLDCGVYHFFVEKTDRYEAQEAWPLLRALIPSRALSRKENDQDLPPQFCRTLGIIDAQLRREWNRSFFTFFCPPLPLRIEYTAFEKGRALGNSSYTVYRPGFSSHKPLLDILSALALEPGTNPLPGITARLHPLSLENELLEELRRESDAVREILKPEQADSYTGETPGFRNSFRTGTGRSGKPLPRPDMSRPDGALSGTALSEMSKMSRPETAYTPPDKITLMEFITSLKETERTVLREIARGDRTPVPETVIDAINGAFYEQFRDLLIETGPEGPSISAGYGAILGEWE